MAFEAIPLTPHVGSEIRLSDPAALLDVKLLLEEKDVETIQAARNLALPPQIQVVIVPDGHPRGKVVITV